jgi:2-Cys peroxiredoxin 5
MCLEEKSIVGLPLSFGYTAVQYSDKLNNLVCQAAGETSAVRFNVYFCHSAILDEHGEPLAANVAKNSGQVQLQVQSLGEVTTSVCQHSHLSIGINEIVCVSVNDPFVMEAWGKDQAADGKVRMLADTCGDLAKALDLQLDLAAVLGNMRCKRFSMLVEDGTVAKVNIEPDGTGLTCSLADKIV